MKEELQITTDNMIFKNNFQILIILKGPLGMRHVVIFENLIYMKLYSLLILTENTEKSKKQF